MTWVNLPIDPDQTGRRSREEREVMRLTDGETCRVRTTSGEELDAECVVGNGFCFRDDDGEPLDVAAVWVRAPGGGSGVGGKTDLVRLPPVYVTKQERERYMEIASRAGESVSAWARRKLAT